MAVDIQGFRPEVGHPGARTKCLGIGHPSHQEVRRGLLLQIGEGRPDPGEVPKCVDRVASWATDFRRQPPTPAGGIGEFEMDLIGVALPAAALYEFSLLGYPVARVSLIRRGL